MSSKRFKLFLRPAHFTTPDRRPFSIRRVWGTPLPKIPRTECKMASPAKLPSKANRQNQPTNVSVAEITNGFVASYGHSDLLEASRYGVLFDYNYIGLQASMLQKIEWTDNLWKFMRNVCWAYLH